MKVLFDLLAITTLFFVSSVSLFAQIEKEDRVYKRSFGIDASFINNFLPIDNVVGFSNDYLFHLIKYKDADKFSRQAFDINISGSFRFEDNQPNINDSRLSFQYKYSRGKTKNLFKKVSVFYGGEMFLDYFFNQRIAKGNNIITIIETTSQRQNIGLSFGPFIGIEYKFNDRFSIWTEAGYYLGIDYAVSTFEDHITANTSKSESIAFSDIYRLPSSIVLFYSF